jgi:hypothetical protein
MGFSFSARYSKFRQERRLTDLGTEGNVIFWVADHLGVGEGQKYLRSRVMPVEGRALSFGVLERKEKSGD